MQFVYQNYFIFVYMNSAILIRQQDSILEESQIKDFLNQSIQNRSIVSSIPQQIFSNSPKPYQKPHRNIHSCIRTYSLTTLKPKNLSINLLKQRTPFPLSKVQKQQKINKSCKKTQQIIKRYYPNKIIADSCSTLHIDSSLSIRNTTFKTSFLNTGTINPEQLKMSLLMRSRIQKNQRKNFFSLQEINKRQTKALMNLNKITNQFFFTHSKFVQQRKYDIKTNICLTKKLMISQSKLKDLNKKREGIPVNPFKRSFRQSDYLQS